LIHNYFFFLAAFFAVFTVFFLAAFLLEDFLAGFLGLGFVGDVPMPFRI
jgi:hypothetical protein